MSYLRFVAVGGTIAALSTPVFAGEGNGEPFPGPNAAIVTDVTHPNYTMGSTAPFNYFTTAQPTQMTNYHAAAGVATDPYPFKMNGQVIRTQPDPRPAIVRAPSANTHG